ncbi:hypothetical protein OEA41_008922 [Lepraria neglecta]|uniref:Uncharacterized protein n=1 Tax=Lepraria neglecta TaxID=209136 RepID=A0AAD9Z4W9_9LECA|nr:hypothetical protein OEA41_008922 [Lepraria neglecta]
MLGIFLANTKTALLQNFSLLAMPVSSPTMPILTTSMTVPEDYSPLETPWNCYIPSISPAQTSRVFMIARTQYSRSFDALKKELWDIDAEFVYGRVQGKAKEHKRDLDGDVIKHPEDDEDED